MEKLPQQIVMALNYDFDLVVRKPITSKYEIIQRSYSSEDEISKEVELSHILIVGRTINISISTIRRLKNCLAIIRPGVGCDNVDTEEARKHNIKIFTIPDYCIDEVADHTMALLLSYARRITAANDRLHEDIKEKWNASPYSNMRRLRDKTLGIIGMGCIGQAVAKRAVAFNMRISYYDPYLKSGMRKIFNGEIVTSIEQLLEVSDYISIHTPLTPETKNIISSFKIEKMNSSVVMINTSRGKVISNKTIFTGLMSGRIEAFLADVLEREPPDSFDPLIHAYMKNEEWIQGRLIITPHIAYLSQESTEEVINQTLHLVDALLGDVNDEFN